jgi:hypothetical protein
MRMIFLLLFSFSLSNIKAQDIFIKDNHLLEFLYNLKEPITSITNRTNKNTLFQIDDKHLTGYTQIILKSNKGLFILVDGTGRAYKATTLTEKGISFQRIDSTHYYGYNSNCIFFSLSDTLYQLGGHGFWERNGQLRYYSELYNEWEIKKLNKKIDVINHLFFIDASKKIVYYLQTPFTDPGSDLIQKNFIITKLDVMKKENSELGIISEQLRPYFLDNYTSNFINVPFLNGTLVNLKAQHQYLIKYDKNEVYRLVNQEKGDLLLGSSNRMDASSTFALKDRIYFTKDNDSTYKLYSFPISMKDFVKEPYPLYEPFEDEKKKLYFYIGGLCMLLIGGSVFFVKKRKQKTTSINTEPSLAVSKKEDNGIDFNPLELELITKMIEQSARGNHFSVEDINTSLGLNRKTLEIQKKIRTETINRINHKFKIKYNLSIDLIERIRSEEDRRYYKYMISGENGKIVLS